MLKERLAQLLSRKMSGEATVPELQELEQWLQLNPDDQYFSDILLTYWNAHHDDAPSIKPDRDQHFAHILEMAEEDEEKVIALPLEAPGNNKVPISRFKKIAVAASVVGLVGLSIWVIGNTNKTNKGAAVTYSKEDDHKKEVIASKGVRSQIVLPDGTKVRLNSDSKLQYEESFSDTIREVTLEGEAYFDVVRDKKRPFIVHTSDIDIYVLGTAFNVKSYPQEGKIEATLLHGLIEVVNKKSQKSSSVTLLPHYKLVYNKEQQDFEKANETLHKSLAATDDPVVLYHKLASGVPDTALKETSWVYDRLEFDGETFRDVATKLERWFNVRIDFKDQKVANEKLHASVLENETLDQALESLQVITPFRVIKKSNNEIIIDKQITP